MIAALAGKVVAVDDAAAVSPTVICVNGAAVAAVLGTVVALVVAVVEAVEAGDVVGGGAGVVAPLYALHASVLGFGALFAVAEYGRWPT